MKSKQSQCSSKSFSVAEAFRQQLLLGRPGEIKADGSPWALGLRDGGSRQHTYESSSLYYLIDRY